MEWAICSILILSISLQKVIPRAHDVKRIITIRLGSFTNQTLVTVTYLSSILAQRCTVTHIVSIFCFNHLWIDLGSEAVHPSMRPQRRFHNTTTPWTQLTDQNSSELEVVLFTWITYPWNFHIDFLSISSSMDSLISLFSMKYRTSLV